MKKYLSLMLLGITVVVYLGVSIVEASSQPEIPTIPTKSVVFSQSPFVDQTYAVIAMKKGWFEEVGIKIEPEPYGKVLLPAQVVSMLIAGGIDVGNLFNPMLASLLSESSEITLFCYADVFYGRAIMGQSKYKSLEEFMKEGLDAKEAWAKAISQLKGKTFTIAPEPELIPVLKAFTGIGGIELTDFELVQTDDPKTTALMVAGRADFQMGSAPTRVTLLKKGFKEIVTLQQFLNYFPLSPESEFYDTIGQAGWACRKEWYRKNHDTVLRLTSVLLRTMDFINENPIESLKLQLPFTNSVAGTELTVEDGIIFYTKLDPLVPFEEQTRWVFDEESAEYYKWNLGAHIRREEKKGVLEVGKWKPEDICSVPEVYRELLELKYKSNLEFAQAELLIYQLGQQGGSATVTAKDLLKKAKYYYRIRNYLDSYRFAVAAREWAEFATK